MPVPPWHCGDLKIFSRSFKWNGRNNRGNSRDRIGRRFSLWFLSHNIFLLSPFNRNSNTSGPRHSINQGSLTQENWFTSGRHCYSLRCLMCFFGFVNRRSPQPQKCGWPRVPSLSHISTIFASLPTQTSLIFTLPPPPHHPRPVSVIHPPSRDQFVVFVPLQPSP